MKSLDIQICYRRKTMPLRPNGLTLVELLVVLAIFTILIVSAAPSFIDTFRNNYVASRANELIVSFSLARSEAVKRSGLVAICAGTDLTCSGTGSNWANGWVIGADTNDDGVVNNSDSILRQIVASDTVDISVNVGDTPVIAFDGRGMRALPTVTNEDRIFTLAPPECPAGKRYKRRISVNPTGRTHIETVDCAS